MKEDPKNLILRGAVDVIVRADLEQKLKSGKTLKIKIGIDPTGARLHLGRATTYRHLKYFQQLGHQVQLVIGTFTGQIGDSSDKDSERPVLTHDMVQANMKNYIKQLSNVFDTSKLEVFYNGDWFNKMPLPDFFKLQELFSVNQMAERDNFALRLKAGKRVGLHEFSYALLQGYDSVKMQSDVEIGGTDQLFNMLAGRTVQKAYNQNPQNVITYELLMGTDGRKMSTTWDNCIYIDDEPAEMFGKIMTVRDELIWDYFRLCTELSDTELKGIQQQLKTTNNPRDLKMRLAKELVSLYHSPDLASQAQQAFTSQFTKGELPQDIQEVELPSGSYDVQELLMQVNLVASKAEARRALEQGGIKLNQKKVENKTIDISSGDVLQIGKRRFVRIR